MSMRDSTPNDCIDVASAKSVLVFIKEPRPGNVKTRLAAAVGDQEAARLYEEWTTAILEGLQSLRATATLIGYYAGSEVVVRNKWRSFVDDWLQQCDGDLGDRLQLGFASALKSGPCVAIGTDCLDVDSQVVASAFDSLEKTDAVLGPASDGGYYLIGLRRMPDHLFAGVQWSSPKTFIQQQKALVQAGMTVFELSMLHDIDTIDDWNAYQGRRSR
jgi:uncharacterized protein